MEVSDEDVVGISGGCDWAGCSCSGGGCGVVTEWWSCETSWKLFEVVWVVIGDVGMTSIGHLAYLILDVDQRAIVEQKTCNL